MMQRTFNKQDGRLTIGLDLGDRSSFYCVLDEPGDVLLEQRVSTTPKAMKEIFGAMPRSRIAPETGTHSPWLNRLLSELGHEPIVAHARSVRLCARTAGTDRFSECVIGDEPSENPVFSEVRPAAQSLYLVESNFTAS
jgi:transposase